MEMTNNAPLANTSPVSATVTMFYEPTRTFQQLEARPRGWFPLILLILSSGVMMMWYFSMVDFAWLLDQMLATMKTAEERDAAAKVMSKEMLQTSTLAATLLAYPVIFALMGVYLMVVSKAMTQGLTFGKGFALAAWSSIPSLLLLPLGATQMMLNTNGQFGFSELNPLSLNQLVFHYDMAHPLAGFMDAVSVPMLWSIFLLVIGFQVWAKVKRATALKVILIPYVTIFALWFAYAMSKAA